MTTLTYSAASAVQRRGLGVALTLGVVADAECEVATEALRLLREDPQKAAEYLENLLKSHKTLANPSQPG
jgi:succinyl-CoA synthetase alpha subunit